MLLLMQSALSPPVWRSLLFSWDGWLLTLALVVLEPAYGCFLYRVMPDPTPRRTKLLLYASIIFSEWLLVVLTLLVLRRHGLSSADLGQRLGIPWLTLAVTILLLTAIAVFSIVNLRQLGRARPEQLAAAVHRVQKLLPVCGLEQATFALVAVTAGICEELLYRGWLVRFLGAGSGSIWAGVIVAGAVFGIAHAYQGPKGMLLTGVLGTGFGVLFVLMGSLVPGQILHTAIDLLNGIVAGSIVSRLRAEAATAGRAALPSLREASAEPASPK